MSCIGHVNIRRDWGYRHVERVYATHCREQFQQNHRAAKNFETPSFSTYLARVNAQDRFERSRHVPDRDWPESRTQAEGNTHEASASAPAHARHTAPTDGESAGRPAATVTSRAPAPAQGPAGVGWHLDVMG